MLSVSAFVDAACDRSAPNIWWSGHSARGLRLWRRRLPFAGDFRFISLLNSVRSK